MSFHEYRINELYSNADGTVQFIELAVGNFNGEGFWAGHSINVSQGASVHSFTFPANLPNQTTANTKVLIATQGYADLGLAQPDFTVPAGFLFTGSGTVDYAGVDSFAYASLPTDGATSLSRSGNTPASPTNFAGASAALSLISGGSGDDVLSSRVGNDVIDGGGGSNTAVFSGPRLRYSVTQTATGYTVRDNGGSDGSDSLSHIQELRFSDTQQNLLIGADAATISPAQLNSLTEIYIAYFNRVPEAGGLDYWINQLRGGMGLNAIGSSFYAAAVSFSSVTGYSSSMSDADFITKIYQNVLGRSSPDAAGLLYWMNGLADGSQTRGSLVNTILAAAHTYKGDPSFGAVADLLDNKLAVGKYHAVSAAVDYLTPADAISHGVAIAAAVSATDTAAAVSLIGLASLVPFTA